MEAQLLEIVIPETPQDINVTQDSPTTKELKEIMAAWLAAAIDDGKIEKLTLIGRYLAEPGEPYPYAYKGDTPPKRFQVGEHCLHYSTQQTISTGYQAYWGRFENITVTIGGDPPHELIDGQRVAWIFQGDSYTPGGKTKLKGDPGPVKKRKKESFYIPNPRWEGAIMQYYGKAIKKMEDQAKAVHDHERSELLEKMGVLARPSQ